MRDNLGRWADPPLLVLASLAEEPKHGYAITQDVAETMGVRLSAVAGLCLWAPDFFGYHDAALPSGYLVLVVTAATVSSVSAARGTQAG